MVERFVDRDVRIFELDVLADQRDFDAPLRPLDVANHRAPIVEIELPVGEAELAAHLIGETFGFQVQRHLIDALRVAALDDGRRRHVAEERDLLLRLLGEREFGPAHDRVGRDTDRPQLAHRVLRRLRLQFVGGAEVRYERQVDIHHVIVADFVLELPDGPEECKDSMSPTVPPTSTMQTSASPASATRLMRFLISFVMCGITWTVPPK